MHNDFNHFIFSLDFEINQFNVGKEYNHAYWILINYQDWILSEPETYTIYINKDLFEKIIDQLVLSSFSSGYREDYERLKKVASHCFSINLLSLYRLFLILKVRVRQIGNNDAELIALEKKLSDIFSPIEWDNTKKKEITIERKLPDISQTNRSNGVILPLALSMLALNLDRIFPSSNIIFIFQILLFFLALALLAPLLKQQKSTKDIEQLKVWEYIRIEIL